MFINLFTQTEYSMLHSTIHMDQLIDSAKQYQYAALAITDDNMHGALKFYQACKKAHIQPIIGLQVRVSTDALGQDHVLLYAQNENGYRNLLQIATRQTTENQVTIAFLKEKANDIIAVLPGTDSQVIRDYLAGETGEAKKRLKSYQDSFSKLYLGISFQTKQEKKFCSDLIRFGEENTIPSVAIHQTNYLQEEDYLAYQTLRCIDLGIHEYTPQEKETNSAFLSVAEAKMLFYNFPDLIKRTVEISQICQLELRFGQYHYPQYGIENSAAYLTELCKVGLNKRLSQKKADVNAYKTRLLYELSIIIKMGFADYFLIVYDYVKYAKQNNILVGPGRGSAPGSLVSYCLGITDIDPLAYDLLFERFLNPERITMPDIDVDFPDDRREEIIQYMGSRFGKNRVAYITTFGTFGARLALRDVARVLQIAEQRLEVVLKEIPSQLTIRLEEYIKVKPVLKQMMDSDEEINSLIGLASRLEGLPRHTSTHAAGVIMADQDLIAYTALQKGLNDMWQTQYEASDLEALGLIKMDVLGLRNLTIIQKVLDLIEENGQKRPSLLQIPLDDPKVYQMIASGDTNGIFQLESKGMRNLLKELKCSNFMDIVHANALFRPGPMEMIPVFVKRKFGEKVTYIHPDLRPILEPTYGTIVFQEQILLITQQFAGYSLGMADILRRAVSKKNSQVLEAERKRFVEQAIKNNHSPAISNEIYDYIVKFANYGFNKNHSVAYSLIAYQMAYLKTHYYPYFMAVLMTNTLGSSSLMQSYIQDCRKHQIIVLNPSINKSTDSFLIEKNAIIYPLQGIANIGQTIVRQIIEERENGLFSDYEDFVFRCANFTNKRIVASLVHAGAMDEFDMTHKEMVESYDLTKEQQSFAITLKNKLIKIERSEDEYEFHEMSIMEKEALGFNLKYNLLLQYEEIKQKEHVTELIDLKANTEVRILFILRRLQVITTKKNQEMAFLECYDGNTSVDGVLFPARFQQWKKDLHQGNAYLGQGHVELRKDKLQIILENVYSL